MNFLQRTPFVRLLLSLITGIILFLLIPDLPKWFLLCLFILSSLVVSISFFIKNADKQYRFRWLFGFGVFLFFITLGYSLSNLAKKKSEFEFSDKNQIYLVELISAPVEKTNSYLCRIELKNYIDNENNWQSVKGKAVVYIQKDSLAAKLLYGDIILIDAKFNPPPKVLNPDAFDYGKYLKRQGFGATTYIGSEKWQKLGENESFSLFRLADISRRHLLNIYRDLGIRGDEFAVLAALILGYTDEINPDILIGYSATGAVHILSVSGLHVGIIYAFLLFLLSFIRKSRKTNILKGIIIILFLWTYAFITGLSPSVMRSAFMFSFVAGALCFDRKSGIYNSIFMSAFFMLLIDPNNLFNIGFQLSYSAVLSIVIFSYPAHKVMKTKNKIAHWTWDTFIVSIAAQLGTAPFTIYYFHQFPLYFLLTNFIAIPLSTFIIYLAIVVLALSFVPYLPVALAFVLDKSVWLLNNSIVSIFNLPSSVIPVSVDFFQMWLLVAVIVFFCIHYHTKKFAPLALGFMFFLMVLLVNIYTKYETLTTQKVMVYAGQRNTHVSFISGEQNTVFTTDSAEIVRLAKNYWDNNKLQKPRFIGENGEYSTGFISFFDKTFLILCDDFLKGKKAVNPMEVDYLIVGAFQKPKMQEIFQCVLPQHVIICNGVSQWYTSHITEVCSQHKIPAYSIAENGAFLLDME